MNDDFTNANPMELVRDSAPISRDHSYCR